MTFLLVDFSILSEKPFFYVCPVIDIIQSYLFVSANYLTLATFVNGSILFLFTKQYITYQQQSV
jgi:hypothetical protein